IMVPFRGGPAHKAGARVNDLILSVDGASTEGKTIAQVVEMIRGEEGTEVTFTVRQPKSDEKRDLRMTRGVVPFEHIAGYRPGRKDLWEFRIKPDEAIGYAHVNSITTSIVHELRDLEKQLRKEEIRALILDLRYSVGYRMQHALLAADALLDGG